jgi:predicted transposase YdaD
LEAANIVFDKTARKVIKDSVKHTCLVSTALYYYEVLYHSLYYLLYLMTNFYLITKFVVLLTSDEATDKATSGTKYLSDQGAAASREG